VLDQRGSVGGRENLQRDLALGNRDLHLQAAVHQIHARLVEGNGHHPRHHRFEHHLGRTGLAVQGAGDASTVLMPSNRAVEHHVPPGAHTELADGFVDHLAVVTIE